MAIFGRLHLKKDDPFFIALAQKSITVFLNKEFNLCFVISSGKEKFYPNLKYIYYFT